LILLKMADALNAVKTAGELWRNSVMVKAPVDDHLFQSARDVDVSSPAPLSASAAGEETLGDEWLRDARNRKATTRWDVCVLVYDFFFMFVMPLVDCASDVATSVVLAATGGSTCITANIPVPPADQENIEIGLILSIVASCAGFVGLVWFFFIAYKHWPVADTPTTTLEGVQACMSSMQARSSTSRLCSSVGAWSQLHALQIMLCLLEDVPCVLSGLFIGRSVRLPPIQLASVAAALLLLCKTAAFYSSLLFTELGLGRCLTRFSRRCWFRCRAVFCCCCFFALASGLIAAFVLISAGSTDDGTIVFGVPFPGAVVSRERLEKRDGFSDAVGVRLTRMELSLEMWTRVGAGHNVTDTEVIYSIGNLSLSWLVDRPRSTQVGVLLDGEAVPSVLYRESASTTLGSNSASQVLAQYRATAEAHAAATTVSQGIYFVADIGGPLVGVFFSDCKDFSARSVSLGTEVFTDVPAGHILLARTWFSPPQMRRFYFPQCALQPGATDCADEHDLLMLVHAADITKACQPNGCARVHPLCAFFSRNANRSESETILAMRWHRTYGEPVLADECF
jgi:hypothetical protein